MEIERLNGDRAHSFYHVKFFFDISILSLVGLSVFPPKHHESQRKKFAGILSSAQVKNRVVARIFGIHAVNFHPFFQGFTVEIGHGHRDTVFSPESRLSKSVKIIEKFQPQAKILSFQCDKRKYAYFINYLIMTSHRLIMKVL